MSIDATVIRAILNTDGTATIYLRATDPKRGPAGQSQLTVMNPPPDEQSLVGLVLWGGADTIMVGRETKWADRIGYTRCRLV